MSTKGDSTMGISFNNNDYGITRKEWRAIKKELKSADKADDSFKLSKSDYKDMKTKQELRRKR